MKCLGDVCADHGSGGRGALGQAHRGVVRALAGGEDHHPHPAGALHLNSVAIVHRTEDRAER